MKIKVLLFTNTSSSYTSPNSNIYNGGGWISSLEEELKRKSDIELGVSFFMDGQTFKVKEERVCYYPIVPQGQKMKDKLKLTFSLNPNKLEKYSWEYCKNKFKLVIQDFSPDIILVFGSEKQFGLVSQITNIPVLLHVQGLLAPCRNAFLPPSFSWHSLLFASLNPIQMISLIKERNAWNVAVMREQEILKNINYYIGRTNWDKNLITLYNPKAKYYHGDEILRPVFYTDSSRKIPNKLIIITTISSAYYKGYDLILKTAQLLVKLLQLDFEWHCYGNINPLVVERIIGIRHENVNIKLMGVATAEALRDAMLGATLYVHSSYIDNSPNSLCEAQMLGVPSIATNVGGTSSLIEHGVTGFLVPANDPYLLAYYIKELYSNCSLNLNMGNIAKEVANKRHNKVSIINGLIEIFSDVIESNKE